MTLKEYYKKCDDIKEQLKQQEFDSLASRMDYYKSLKHDWIMQLSETDRKQVLKNTPRF